MMQVKRKMGKVIRGVSYHIEIYGEGVDLGERKPLVLLHGFTGSAESWHPFLETFSGHKVILIDLIGHGKTAGPGKTAGSGKSESPESFERYSMEEAVQDLNAIFEELALDKVKLAGYSMGGRLALSYAIKHPDKIEKLILESASPGLRTEAERQSRKENDQKLADSILEQGIVSFTDFWENISLFASQKALPADRQAKLRNQRLKNNEAGLANSLLGMGTGSQPSWWDKLHTLKMPVLIVCGELDKKFCEIAKEMNELLPNPTLLKINSAGHAVHVEQPRIFGKIVSEFINNQ